MARENSPRHHEVETFTGTGLKRKGVIQTSWRRECQINSQNITKKSRCTYEAFFPEKTREFSKQYFAKW